MATQVSGGLRRGAEAFDAERGDRWSSTAKIENEDEKEAELRHLPGDAYAADYLAAADAARTENVETTDDTPKPDRASRPGKAQSKE